MRVWILAGTLLLTLAVSGCDSQRAGMFAPTAESKTAERVLGEIREGNFAPIAAAIDPSIKAQLTPDVLKQLQTLLAREPAKSHKLVGNGIEKFNDLTRYGISYEYEFESQWILAQVVLQTRNGRQTIAGIHVQPLPQSLEQLNAFTFFGKSAIEFVFLGLTILVPVFIIWTAIVCWRTPIPKRKWLWRIFVLIGLTAFEMNWTSGAVQFLLFRVQILGAGFLRNGYGPWMLQLGVPVGAILFWTRRKAWGERAEVAPDVSG